MRSEDTRETLIITWAASRPVLLKRLAVIASDDPDNPGELIATFYGLLEPDRPPWALACLKATGAPVHEADALWEALTADGPGRWDATVDWLRVARTLARLHTADCTRICARPHPKEK